MRIELPALTEFQLLNVMIVDDMKQFLAADMEIDIGERENKIKQKGMRSSNDRLCLDFPSERNSPSPTST